MSTKKEANTQKVSATRKTSSRVGPQKLRRASGRPSAGETVGHQRILDATIELLKERSPEQLSILEIAAAAGVTRTLVRYYYGDLHGLLVVVTEQLLRQLQDQMDTALRTEGALHERIYQRLQLRLNFMREHPHFEHLALSEIYHGPPSPSGAGKADTPLHRVMQRGMELTALLQPEPAGDVDTRHLHLAILSISAFIPSAQPLLDQMFGKGKKGERGIENYLRFIAHTLADRLESRRT